MGEALDPSDEADGELRRRLYEAEATLRAIRDGEVDALVMRGDEADRVFSLTGEESYRAFMEAMDLGAAAIDRDYRLLYANAALCTLLGISAEKLQHKGLLDAVGPDCAQLIGTLSSRAAADRQRAQVVLPCAAGEKHVVLTMSGLPLGFDSGFAVTFTDVTERVTAAAAEESERIARAVMTSANEAMVVVDREGIVTDANSAARAILDADPLGKPFAESFPLGFPMGSGLMDASDLVAVALAGNSIRGIEAAAPGLAVHDLLLSAAPLRVSGDAVSGCVVTMVDLSERKAAEQQQALVAGELAHRVKNTLTMVLSIHNRTLLGARDLKDYSAKFAQRIAALSATHDLLAEGAWARLTLKDLIAAELAPYVAPYGPRIRLQGLEAPVTPNTAVALGLIFHELVTNAVKYGALSNEAGCITIQAKRTGEGALEICWEESKGPPVVPPSRKGFGQTVIARGLGGGGSSTEVDFRPEGLFCRMVIDRSALA